MSRSRCVSRRLTIPAPRLPCFSRRAMLAREEAVNAVSLPAKKADSSRQSRTIRSESQSFALIGFQSGALDFLRSCVRQLAGQKVSHLGRIDVVFDKSVADAPHQYECELAAPDFLVLPEIGRAHI